MTKDEKEQDKHTQKTGDKKGDNKDKDSKDDKKDSGGAPLSEQDIALFKRYGKGPYSDILKKSEDEMKDLNQKITVLSGIKESDTGLSLPAQWNLA